MRILLNPPVASAFQYRGPNPQRRLFLCEPRLHTAITDIAQAAKTYSGENRLLHKTMEPVTERDHTNSNIGRLHARSDLMNRQNHLGILSANMVRGARSERVRGLWRFLPLEESWGQAKVANGAQTASREALVG